jgi:hypothetical protein
MRFIDGWSSSESGGLPVKNTEPEFIAWAKNPQYYLKVNKDITLYMALLQPDGRMTRCKFPYPETTKKACIIISKALGKKRLTSFTETEHVFISPVRQHRENSVFRTLLPGEYIVSLCCLTQGDTGVFCFELYVEDSFVDSSYDDTNFTKKFKNTYIERLGNPNVVAKLMKETSVEEIQELNEKKKIFMYQQFKTMLTRNDKLTSQPKNKTTKKEEEDYF